MLPRRDHAHRNGDAERQDQGQDHQRDGRLDPLRDHVGDRQVGEDRGAQIAVQDVPEPVDEAHQERPVEAERGADALDVGGRGLVAGDDRGGIARGDVEQTEDEQRHHQHDRDRGEDAADDVGQHQRGQGSALDPQRGRRPL